MERLLQYLDDLDDLYGMARLLSESLRRGLVSLAAIALVVAAILIPA